MKILIAVLLIVHGLITAAFATGSFQPWPPVENPAWLRWWPARMGESALLPRGAAQSRALGVLGGVLYLASGLALIAAGLGLLGWLISPAAWAGLALAGAAGCLLMLLVYFHPYYLVGIASNLALLASILWLHWPAWMHLPG